MGNCHCCGRAVKPKSKPNTTSLPEISPTYPSLQTAIEPLIQDVTKESSLPEYCADEVAKHNNIQSLVWVIIGDFVYDVTVFIKANLHPSSNAFIAPYYGRDATEPFDAIFHSVDAVNILTRYKIGKLKNPRKLVPLKHAISSRKPLSNVLGIDNKKTYVSSLFIFPVKGCKGLSVQRAELTRGGFVDDRIYAVVHKATQKVVNQLTYCRLALIHVAFKDGTNNCDEGIQLNDEFVPFVKEKTLKVEWKSCTTKILVYDQGEAISKWITSFLNTGDEFIFVRIHEENYRESEEFFALTFSPKETQRMSAFQNYCPVLLASEESLKELNRRYKAREHTKDEEKEVNWDRFRMNIIISGVPIPHYEDFMKYIAFGDMATKRAEILWSRRRYFCAVPQVNQNNGVQTMEPKATTRRYRNAVTLNDRTSLPGDDAVFFGSLYCVKHTGVIQVGETVISEYTNLRFDERTLFGKSFFGLKETNIGSQFMLDYNTQYSEFKLVKKGEYNHDTITLRFKMIAKEKYVFRKPLKESLQMGDHYLLKYVDDEGNLIIRAYTPLFDFNNDFMSFDLLVKVYLNGKMSQHLNNMNINDSILCKKNYGKVCYKEIGRLRFGDPRFTMFSPYTLNVKKINLIAGGSGITPIYQIIRNIDLNKELDETEISVIYANKSIDDILLKDKLDEITKSNKNIKIHFVVERADSIERDIDIGRITMDICSKHLFAPNKNKNDVATLLCGPTPMEQAVKSFLNQIGYNHKSIATF